MWLLGVCDEELGFIGVRPGVCHRDYAARVELSIEGRSAIDASGTMRAEAVEMVRAIRRMK